MRKSEGHRILVVDDEPAVIGFLTHVLSSAGYEVLAAQDGNGALLVLKHQSVDLLVTDLVMPELDGLELIRRLRQRGQTLPIIAISGAFEGQFLASARVFGARATLLKPFSIAQLLEAVQEVLTSCGG